MPLDPQVRALLDQFAGRPAVNTLPVEVGRRAYRESSMKLIPAPEAPVSVESRQIDGPGGAIGLRIYRPPLAVPDLPLVVFFHGGGWVVCDLDTHDAVCRRLSLGADAVVVSVDYRLAPEHRAPAAADDCTAATRWAVANAASLGADPRRFVIAGDSAGGNLAAAVSFDLRETAGPMPAGQLLVYPVTEHPSLGRYASYTSFADGYGLTAEVMHWFWRLYVGEHLDEAGARALSPRVAPMHADSLAGLPPAMVLTAEYDVLRDEGEAYAARLREAGVDTVAVRCDGMHHGFFNWGGVLDGADRAHAQACAWIRERTR